MRASLRAEYNGLDLREVFTSRTMPVSDLIDLVLWLPLGCALWRDFGGPAALSAEARELRVVEFRLRELIYLKTKGKKPDPPRDPELASDRAAKRRISEGKAAAFMERASRRV